MSKFPLQYDSMAWNLYHTLFIKTLMTGVMRLQKVSVLCSTLHTLYRSATRPREQCAAQIRVESTASE